MRLADGRASGQPGKSPSGRGGQASHSRIPGGECGGNAVQFQGTGCQSHGLGAQWSSRDQQSGVNRFGSGRLNNGRDQFINGPFNIRLKATKTDDRWG